MKLKKFLVLLLNCLNFSNSDWVKIPEIKVENSTPRRVSPVTLKSDVLSSVFKFQVIDSTSERTAVLSNPNFR